MMGTLVYCIVNATKKNCLLRIKSTVFSANDLAKEYLIKKKPNVCSRVAEPEPQNPHYFDNIKASKRDSALPPTALVPTLVFITYTVHR
jgi:hypothetical protein